MLAHVSIPKTGTGKYEDLLAKCRGLDPIPTAVAHPCDLPSLSGAIEAASQRLIEPILVGPRAKIEAAAISANLDLSNIPIVDTPQSVASAAKAVELVREAKAELLMKGSLHTDELMGAVVSHESGLRTARRIVTYSLWTFPLNTKSSSSLMVLSISRPPSKIKWTSARTPSIC